MKFKIHLSALLIIVLAGFMVSCHQQQKIVSQKTETVASTNPLPSWNDGPAKKSIIDFVNRTTKESSAGFIPVTPTCGPCLGGHMGILAVGRAMRVHHEPQLRGPHGPPDERGVPRLARGRRGRGRDREGVRPDRRSPVHGREVAMQFNGTVARVRRRREHGRDHRRPLPEHHGPAATRLALHGGRPARLREDGRPGATSSSRAAISAAAPRASTRRSPSRRRGSAA